MNSTVIALESLRKGDTALLNSLSLPKEQVVTVTKQPTIPEDNGVEFRVQVSGPGILELRGNKVMYQQSPSHPFIQLNVIQKKSSLRASLIKLAYEKPELRDHLLPLVTPDEYQYEMEELKYAEENYKEALKSGDPSAIRATQYALGMASEACQLRGIDTTKISKKNK